MSGMPADGGAGRDAGRRAAGTPFEVSVIVVSEGRGDTVRCLHALAAMESEVSGGFEVLVVYTRPGDLPADRGFPFSCRWIRSRTPNRSSCWNLAVSKAKAARVAFLAGDAVPQPGWLRAAVAVDPAAAVMRTGPEPPLNPLGRSGCVYSALNSPLTSILWPRGSGAAREVRWYQVSLRNLVVPRRILGKTGRFDESLPEAASAADFLLRASPHVSFEADPGLKASTDAYPEDLRGLWEYAFDLAVDSGAGLGSCTHLFGRSLWILGWSIGPWVVANFLVFAPWFRIPFLVGYPLLMLARIPRIKRIPGNRGVWRGLLCLPTVQLALAAGMQVGLARWLLRALGRGRPLEA